VNRRHARSRQSAAEPDPLASNPSVSPQVPVLGSGYIQLPPQKRFEKPLVMQPPTVAVRFRAPPPRRV
jgi:hypothetical protein